MRLRRRIAFLLFLAAAPIACHSRADRVIVGSKNFSEQVLLGEIVAQTLEARTDLVVERRLNLGGTFICDRAIRAGELDVYVEYTGTAFTAILKRPATSDARQVLETVRSEYARSGLVWTRPFGFDNTFAIVIRGTDGEKLGIRTIGEAAAHTPKWRAGFGYEFMERADGYEGLARTYGLQFREPPRVMDLGLLYRALVDGQVDLVAGNSTDGLIASLRLRALADDRHYFPPYEAAPVVRKELIDRRPEVLAALDSLGGAISAEDMRRLNYRIDGEHASAEEVAREFVLKRGQVYFPRS
jgi:glycine betaine/choline ABC-type transport system substrate-binding protein